MHNVHTFFVSREHIFFIIITSTLNTSDQIRPLKNIKLPAKPKHLAVAQARGGV